MTQIEKIIIRLYRNGYLVDAIARATGEEISYVGFVVDSYLGQARPEGLSYRLAPVIGAND